MADKEQIEIDLEYERTARAALEHEVKKLIKLVGVTPCLSLLRDEEIILALDDVEKFIRDAKAVL